MQENNVGEQSMGVVAMIAVVPRRIEERFALQGRCEETIGYDGRKASLCECSVYW